MIKAGAYGVEILNSDSNLIVTHKRLYGDEKESMYWIPYLELLSKRPTALKYTGLFSQLPELLRTYLDKCDYESKKKSLRLFSKMTEQAGIEKAIEAFEEGIKYGAKDAESIWVTYCRLRSGVIPEIEMVLPERVPELKAYLPDLGIYDQLIKSGGVK